jgi:isocitrate dehydrogenase
MAKQTEDSKLSEHFATLHASLSQAENTVVSELNAVQGHPADTGGYYRLNQEKAERIMRPSNSLNAIINGFHAS